MAGGTQPSHLSQAGAVASTMGLSRHKGQKVSGRDEACLYGLTQEQCRARGS